MGEEERIYRAFTGELEEWSRTDKTPTTGNQDIRYYLELQRERLRKRGLRMEYRFRLRGEYLDNIHSTTYKDRIYTNKMTNSSYLQKTVFSVTGRCCMKKKIHRDSSRPSPGWTSRDRRKRTVVPTVVQSVP